MMEWQTLIQSVHDAYNAGLCINPPRQDGSKAPLGVSDNDHRWKQFITKRPTWEQVEEWYKNPERTGIALFCGAVSDNLEVIDFDDRKAYRRFKRKCGTKGLGELVDRIESGYHEYSPNGVHWLYKCSEIAGSTKLATRPKSESEKKHKSDNTKVLIETRGEGSYIVIAPSYGAVNPSGSYVLKSGSLLTIATITPEERKTLHDIARSLHISSSTPDVKQVASVIRPTHTDGTRPGDAFNERASWEELLTSHGWSLVFTKGETGYWRRSGKSKDISATTNHEGCGFLIVFSTSTPFEPWKGYSKFSAYAVLNHGGDHVAAARELAQMGYGEPIHKLVPSATKVTSRNNTPISEPTKTPADPHEPECIEADAPDLFTDMRVSEFFGRMFFTVVRYWPASNKWFVFDGVRWCADALGGPYPLIRNMIHRLYEMAQNITDDKKRIEFIQGILKLEGHQKQTILLSACQKLPELIINGDMLDADPMKLNTRNGTIDLKTGELKPHFPDDFITKAVDVGYDKNSQCPTFLRFLDQIFNGNQNLIGYIQRYLGYCLTGRIDEQVLVFFYGEGANGKTTLANIIDTLLGDLATTANSDLLMHRDNKSSSNDLAILRGTRLVKVAEIDDGERLSEAQIKTLTGGDRVTCRFLYGEFFTYTPTYKILLLGNYKPKVRGRDYGIWRRIHLIPFHLTIPECDRDTQLLDKLKAELSGILAWAVRGCLEWQRIGLCPPPEVTAEVEQYKRSEDIFQQWLDECCHLGNQYETPASALLKSFSDYTNWRHMSMQKFGRLLSSQGFERIKSNTVSWQGIGLEI